MLDYIWDETKKFINEMPKSERKKKGQFFTPIETARYMAGMFTIRPNDGEISVLDPGAGTGILTAAFLERVQLEKLAEYVSITCYETDSQVLPVLKRSLEYIQNTSDVRVEYTIKEKDYLLSQASDFENDCMENHGLRKYDCIIGNPPYLRITKNDRAASSMSTVVHGAPNQYFLFASMSFFNLKKEGEMVYIMPRSWTSGLYFRSFREYLLKHGRIEHVHLFTSRNKVFSQEEVLQETIIIKIKKTERKPARVIITSSQSSGDFNSINRIELPYDTVVGGAESYVFLPTSVEETNTIQSVNRYSETFPNIGVKMKTGLVVDFRHREYLRQSNEKGTVPLFYSHHIRNGLVNHLPSGKDMEWIVDAKPGLVQKNKNYIFCKRFTAKEERRRLQCGIYLASDFLEFSKISTHNKVNFMEKTDGDDLTPDEMYGIYALLNSTLFDTYYRILDGSTQVNSTEINNIPIPPLSDIREIGRRLIRSHDLSTDICDKILSDVSYG